MSHVLTGGASFDWCLFEIDTQEAKRVQSGGCRMCGGALHVANYPRKPRGDADGCTAAPELRFSFCCAACRRRMTPPSIRFLAWRVYLAAAVVLAVAARQGLDERRARRLRVLTGIDRRTLERWVDWWREEFPKTDTWTELRGDLAEPCDPITLPLSLLERIDGSSDECRLRRLLELLRPLSLTPLMRRRLTMVV